MPLQSEKPYAFTSGMNYVLTPSLKCSDHQYNRLDTFHLVCDLNVHTVVFCAVSSSKASSVQKPQIAHQSSTVSKTSPSTPPALQICHLLEHFQWYIACLEQPQSPSAAPKT